MYACMRLIHACSALPTERSPSAPASVHARDTMSSIALFDLPNESLSHAASYLASPTRALLVIAINDVIDNELSSVILGSGNGEQHNREEYDILDFGEIERTLAAKITDDLLREILICIDANTNLRRLKLTGCVNITGAGLDHLRGSAVLEQIDLSLVAEHESPEFQISVDRLAGTVTVLDVEPLLSCVLPILDSIIERDDNVLRSIVFPKRWRRVGNAVLTDFLGRCNQMFRSRNISCVKCDLNIISLQWFPLRGKFYGLQKNTCYSCTKHFCYNCTVEENGGLHLKYCENCEKERCHECMPVEQCDVCESDYCKQCNPIEQCRECGDFSCGDCQIMGRCRGTIGGIRCSATFCERCTPSECAGCLKPFCDDCRDFHVCKKCGRFHCGDCSKSKRGTFCEHCA